MCQENSWFCVTIVCLLTVQLLFASFFSKLSAIMILHAPYETIFLQLKLPLCGHFFESINSIKENSLQTLEGYGFNGMF